MAVRSDRLAGPTVVVGGGLPPLFTVPAGETWLVKRICSQNLSTLIAETIRFGVFLGITGNTYRVTIPAGGVDDHETWQALDAGASFVVDTTGGDGFVVVIFGAKLKGVAP